MQKVCSATLVLSFHTITSLASLLVKKSSWKLSRGYVIVDGVCLISI